MCPPRVLLRAALPLLALFALHPPTPATAASTFDVKSFGAAGDGKILDTPAIQKAIDAAASAGAGAGGGGGIVRFPPGDYLSVSIHVKSSITLQLDKGATLIAAEPDPVKGINYDPPEGPQVKGYQDFGHSHWHNALIWGEELDGVSIVGDGAIDGKGIVRGHKKLTDQADKTISLKNCRNVALRGFTLAHGGHAGILATGGDGLVIENLVIDTNRDGIDIDCCRNVKIDNCQVNAPMDDGICMKSSYALNEIRSCENISITRCKLSAYAEGTLLDKTYKRAGSKNPNGRIKFGTESNGGLKNCTISDCTFTYSFGLALESVDGGIIEDVTIDKLTMKDVQNAPIFLRLGGRLRTPLELRKMGALRRVKISNITVDNADPRDGCQIAGIPDHPIEDLELSNIRIKYRGGIAHKQITTQPAELETMYAEPGMFGTSPAYGLWLRHVRNINCSNIAFSTENPDPRPALLLEDVQKIAIDALKADHAPEAPVVQLKDVRDFSLKQSPPLPDTQRDTVRADRF